MKKSSKFTVYVTEAELAALKHAAVDAQRTLTKYVRVKLGLDKEGKK